MINIAICDDDRNEQVKLEKIVQAFEKQHTYNICCTVFQNGVDLISEIKTGSRFHIILIDIIMPLVNGIEIAKEIRFFDSLTKIIFISSSPEFAVESYGVEAFYYLVKPPSEEKLTALFEKAISDVFETPDESLLLNTKSGLTKVYLHNIEFVEIIGRQLNYHLKNGQIFEAKGTLGELEKALLSYEQFIKPHRSYIINMDCIDTITSNEIRTQSNKPVPISRKNYLDIKKTYMDYSFEARES